MKKTTDLMKEWTTLYEEKNHDYGTSWQKVGKILDIIFDGQKIEINTVKQKNAMALLVRILDKICRFSNLFFSNKDAKINEKLTETCCDGGTYLFMLGSLVSDDDL